MRALAGLMGGEGLVSPILVGIGWIGLWSVCRSIWGERSGPITAALLLYLSSSQILTMGMTAFAMSGHLSLNMLWLALYRRGGAIGHGSAMLVGFFATGLHQPLFHPLFVLPFLVLFAQRGEWRLLAAYVAAYAVIGIFWISWPLWITAHGTVPVPPG